MRWALTWTLESLIVSNTELNLHLSVKGDMRFGFYIFHVMSFRCLCEVVKNTTHVVERLVVPVFTVSPSLKSQVRFPDGSM